MVFRFALKNFCRESLIYMRDDDDEVQHTHNNKKVSYHITDHKKRTLSLLV